MRLKVSKKYILDIYEYMSNYLNVPYTGSNKLTHKEMNMFLYEKHLSLPKAVNHESVSNEDILRGKCYVVSDEINKKRIYRNFDRIENLLFDLNSEKDDYYFSKIEKNFFEKPKVKIRKKRKK